MVSVSPSSSMASLLFFRLTPMGARKAMPFSPFFTHLPSGFHVWNPRTRVAEGELRGLLDFIVLFLHVVFCGPSPKTCGRQKLHRRKQSAEPRNPGEATSIRA